MLDEFRIASEGESIIESEIRQIRKMPGREKPIHSIIKRNSIRSYSGPAMMREVKARR